MKSFDIKRAVIVIGCIAAALVLAVGVKFLIIDPADENARLRELVSKNEAELEQLRDKVSQNDADAAAQTERIASLVSEIAALEERNAQLADEHEQSFAKQLDELKSLVSSLEGKNDDLTSRLGAAEEAVLELESALEAAEKAENTAYTSLIAEYTTLFTYADSGRVTNLTVAARSLTGSIILPGETFSFFDVVGECTVPKGYRESKIFLQGEIAEGIGGGICQVSSTLYNAALLSGMTITERYNHSMKVSYVKPGRDATVSYGYLDLKFVNPYEYPVKLIAEIADGKLTFAFYAEYKTIKAPTVEINVTVNKDGDYEMVRTVNGKTDYRNVSHYKD